MVKNLLVPKNIIVSGIGIDQDIKGDKVFARFHILHSIVIHPEESTSAQERKISIK